MRRSRRAHIDRPRLSLIGDEQRQKRAWVDAEEKPNNENDDRADAANTADPDRHAAATAPSHWIC
jgi:hypothetical protein